MSESHDASHTRFEAVDSILKARRVLNSHLTPPPQPPSPPLSS